LAKKLEIIYKKNVSKRFKDFRGYLKSSRLFTLAFVIFVLLYIFFINFYLLFNSKIRLNNIPLISIIFLILFLLFTICFVYLSYFYSKKINKIFKNNDKKLVSLVNSIDLLIYELKPYLGNLCDSMIPNEVKKAISIHIYFLNFLITNKDDYNTIIDFITYFYDILFLIIDQLFKEKNDEINNIKSFLTKFTPSFFSDIILKLFPDWHNIIENNINKEISSLSLGIESLQNLQTQFNKEINDIEKKLNGLDVVIKKIATDNTDNFKIFFESFNKIIKKIYNDYELVQSNFNQINKAIETINELSKDISVIAFNIEIEASKVKDSKVFTVLAREVRNFSNQLSEYYLSINNRISDMNKFLSTNNYNEQYIKKNLFSFLDKIELLISEYDKMFLEIRQLNNQLIYQNKENQKLFLMDINENLKNIQKLAIYLEELEHRNKFANSLFEKMNSSISDLFQNLQISNIDNNERKEFYKKYLNDISNLITTKDEINFLKKAYKELLNEEYLKKDIELENKYKSKDGKDEGIIIF